MLGLQSISRLARVASCAALCLVVVSGAADAQRRGGGARGGMRAGGGRPSGGMRPSGGTRTSVNPNIGRSAGGARPTTLPSTPGRTGTAAGQLPSRPGGGGGGIQAGGGAANRPGAGGGGIQGGGQNRPSQLPSRPGAGGGGIQGSGNRGDINIDRDNIANINHGGDWDNWHPGWAAGAVVGAAVAAAAIGSMVYALPPGCGSAYYTGYTYYDCGGVWYQPQYEGDDVVYVVVENPSGTSDTTKVKP